VLHTHTHTKTDLLKKYIVTFLGLPSTFTITSPMQN